MATLTTSWQSYASATWSGSQGASLTFYLEARYTSQNQQNNTTNVETRLRSDISGSLRGSGYEFTCTYCNTRSGTGIWTFEDEVIISGGNTVTHNTDGSKSITLSATAKNNYWNINKSMSVTVSLPKIDRLAVVTSATDFTDEGNPTVYFDNPAGFTAKPYLNFYNNSNTLVYQLYRDISATSPYTWNITSSERTALRNATNQQQIYRVNVGVDTYSGSTKLGYNSIAKQMTYINASPTQSLSTVETNQNIINLLGTSAANTIVQDASQITATNSVTALKGASIVSVTYEYQGNSVTRTTSPYQYDFAVGYSNTIKVTTRDSRGFETWYPYTKTIIGYTPMDILSFSFARQSPTSTNIILNAEIKYAQATFGSTPNVPTILWKLGENGTWNAVSSSDYTLDTTNNRITISNLILNNILAYTSSSYMFIYVSDLLTADSDSTIVPKGIPTIDAGEHDFKVNGQFYIADANGGNIKEIRDLIYPVGSIYLSLNSTNPTYLFGGTWELIPGRIPIGYGASGYNTNDRFGSMTDGQHEWGITAGETYGQWVHKLTTGEMPSHSHYHSGSNTGKIIGLYTSGSSTRSRYSSGTSGGYAFQDDNQSNLVWGGNTTGNTGNDEYHNNMPPVIGVYMWKRTA